MEKDKIFFGENGNTSTSANYLSNIAKELYQDIESKLNYAVFFNSSVSLIGHSEESTLKEGVNPSFLADIEPNLKKISELKALISWFREALKAKENLINEARTMGDFQIAEILGIEIPKTDFSYIRLTVDDIIATWSIKQRNRYYYLETLCAVYGKYIHPDGALAKERENLSKIETCKNEFSGQGREMVIFHYEPTCSMEDVDKTFFELQSHYREYQAELNSMKHDIELKLQEDDREKSAKESLESSEFQSAMKVYKAKVEEYRKAKIAELQALKIIIPDSLKDVYTVVSKAGKE